MCAEMWTSAGSKEEEAISADHHFFVVLTNEDFKYVMTIHLLAKGYG